MLELVGITRRLCCSICFLFLNVISLRESKAIHWFTPPIPTMATAALDCIQELGTGPRSQRWQEVISLSCHLLLAWSVLAGRWHQELEFDITPRHFDEGCRHPFLSEQMSTQMCFRPCEKTAELD